MKARETLREVADRADDYVAEHDHCLFCFLVCPLAHDHHTEDERYCIYGHADDCPAAALRALADRWDALESEVKYERWPGMVLQRLDASLQEDKT